MNIPQSTPEKDPFPKLEVQGTTPHPSQSLMASPAASIVTSTTSCSTPSSVSTAPQHGVVKDDQEASSLAWHPSMTMASSLVADPFYIQALPENDAASHPQTIPGPESTSLVDDKQVIHQSRLRKVLSMSNLRKASSTVNDDLASVKRPNLPRARVAGKEGGSSDLASISSRISTASMLTARLSRWGNKLRDKAQVNFKRQGALRAGSKSLVSHLEGDHVTEAQAVVVSYLSEKPSETDSEFEVEDAFLDAKSTKSEGDQTTDISQADSNPLSSQKFAITLLEQTMPSPVRPEIPLLYQHAQGNASAPELDGEQSTSLVAIPIRTSPMRSFTAPVMRKRLTFASTFDIHATWAADDYDRRGESATCNSLTPLLAKMIKEELNLYKSEEMQVHPSSTVFTHYFP